MVLLHTACGSESPDLDQWYGEHVVYESNPSFQVCQGTHVWVDNFIPFVLGELEVETAPIQYYQWLEREMLDCRDGIPGCSRGDVATSEQPFLLHELVHSTLHSLEYPYQPFFGEGIAVAFDPLNGNGGGPTYLAAPPGHELADPRPWMILTTAELHQPGGYHVAGSFVSFLLARHGPAAFLAFTRRLDGARDFDVIKQAFAATYKLDLDAEAEAFMVVDAPCPDDQFNPILYDCTAPEVGWDGERWFLDEVMDCGSDAVVGGVRIDPAGSWPGLRAVTFKVPASGTYQLRMISDEGVFMQLGRCLVCPWQRNNFTYGVDASGERTVELAAGLHYVRVVAHSNSKSSFTVEVNKTDLGEP